MRGLSRLSILVFVLAFGPAWAEYRVFQLKIEKPATAENPAPEPRMILSTLDPDQYRLYHPVAPDEVVTYTDTWRCRGRTDGKDFCPSPRSPASSAESPASGESGPARPPTNY